MPFFSRVHEPVCVRLNIACQDILIILVHEFAFAGLGNADEENTPPSVPDLYVPIWVMLLHKTYARLGSGCDKLYNDAGATQQVPARMALFVIRKYNCLYIPDKVLLVSHYRRNERTCVGSAFPFRAGVRHKGDPRAKIL